MRVPTALMLKYIPLKVEEKSALSPTTKKILGITLMLLSIGFSLVPIVGQLGFAINTFAFVSSSVCWLAGNIIYQSSKTPDLFKMQVRSDFSASPKLKKCLGVALLIASFASNILPIVLPLSAFFKWLLWSNSYVSSFGGGSFMQSARLQST